MRVTIDSDEVKVKSGTSTKTGKDWEIASQVYYLDTGKRYPAECKTRLADPKKPWPPGEYTVDVEASSYVNKFGALTFSEELVLIPLGEVQ